MNDEQITELYNANATTAQIAAQLNIPQWQVADALARLRPSGVLTKRKRTSEAEARQLLTEAGADFTALATFAPETWQPEAARLLDAGCAASWVARFMSVSKSRLHKWNQKRKAEEKMSELQALYLKEGKQLTPNKLMEILVSEAIAKIKAQEK